MRAVHACLRRPAAFERGLTLVEVLVAMFVFAIISTMVLSSLLQMMSINSDSRARHVAANLAAAEIDLALDTPQLFSLLPRPARAVTVDGRTYRVAVETAWVADGAAVTACGVGDSSLRYKRVEVSVTWDGMRSSAVPVRADTLVTHTDRVFDPTKGTVLVTVIDSRGGPVPGATVSLSATSGGGVVSPVTTDAQGCAYVLLVPTGTYEVSIFKPNYVDIDHQIRPVRRDVAIDEGGTRAVDFQYDLAATLDVRFAANATSTVTLPANLDLTAISTLGTQNLRVTNAATTSTDRPVLVHPNLTYRLFAGRSANDTCTSADPLEWPAADVRAASPEIDTSPGGRSAVQLSMGIVRFSSNVQGLTATPATSTDPIPQCSAGGAILSYGNLVGSSNRTIALPFGSWRLTNRDGQDVSSSIQSGGFVRDRVLTIDPRGVTP